MSYFYNVTPNLDREAPLRQYSVQRCPAIHTGCVPSAVQCRTARVRQSPAVIKEFTPDRVM